MKLLSTKISISFEGKYAPKDQRFIDLYKQVLRGEIPYYWGLVKTKAIKPFSDFKPEITEVDKKLFFNQLAKNDFPSLHVYEQGDEFVMSDDYKKFYFYLELGWKEIPCYIIGKTSNKSVADLTEVKLKRE